MATKSTGEIVGALRSERAGVRSEAVTAEPATPSAADPSPGSSGDNAPPGEGTVPEPQAKDGGTPKAAKQPAKVYTHDDAVRLARALDAERAQRRDAEKRVNRNLETELQKVRRDLAELRTPKEPPKKPEQLSDEAFAEFMADPHKFRESHREETKKAVADAINAYKAEQHQAAVKKSYLRASKAHADYGEAIKLLPQILKANPAVEKRLVQDDDPAELAYQLCKDFELAGGETSAAKLREKYRSEFREELKAKGVDVDAIDAGADEGGGGATVTQIRPTPSIAGKRGSATPTGARRDASGRFRTTGEIVAQLRAERRRRA